MLFKEGADVTAYFGGTANLQTIQNTKTPFLPVKLRPREPNAKPIFADRAKTQTFLLHVTKKKRSHGELTGKIATVTSEKFVCEGMVDYQYLAANQYTECCASGPLDVRLRTYLQATTQDDLELIPEVFSRVDLPLKYEFKQRPQYNESQAPSSELKQVPRHFFTYANFRSNAPLVEIRGTRRLMSESMTSLLPKSKKSHRRMPYRSRLNMVFQVNDAEDKVAMHLKKKKAHNRSQATVKATTGDDRPNATLVIYGVPLREGFFYVQLCDLIAQNPAVKELVAPFSKRLRSSASVWGGWYPMCMFPPIREMLKLHIVTTVGRPADEIRMRQAQIDRAVRNALEELESRGDADSEEDKDKPRSKDPEDESKADDDATNDGDEDDEASGDEQGNATEDENEDDGTDENGDDDDTASIVDSVLI
ncbi:hypothetical protein DYB32_003049 [Aphanomyces invadans]|uniref:Transcription factor IIIC subunit Tfc1/Sfc1 triple barrel domain-containing protein n=1 Tax=Aphanomyces invadans TaxID=157072 RepID=A0A418B1Q1_9STRA|nr:hypothetical protein DYB32_003049 [Aphanomyces invadans]